MIAEMDFSTIERDLFNRLESLVPAPPAGRVLEWEDLTFTTLADVSEVELEGLLLRLIEGDQQQDRSHAAHQHVRQIWRVLIQFPAQEEGDFW